MGFKTGEENHEPLSLAQLAGEWLADQKLVCAINSARYIRTLSILQASSVPLLEGMYIAMDGIENLYARQVLEQAADTVRQALLCITRWTSETLSADHAVYDCLRRRERGISSLMDRAAENRIGITASNYVNAVGI